MRIEGEIKQRCFVPDDVGGVKFDSVTITAQEPVVVETTQKTLPVGARMWEGYGLDPLKASEFGG